MCVNRAKRIRNYEVVDLAVMARILNSTLMLLMYYNVHAAMSLFTPSVTKLTSPGDCCARLPMKL